MMPQFWKLDALQWLNPDHIVHVEDAPQVEPPTLRVKMLVPEPTVQGTAAEPYVLVLTGEARDTVLAYLARETESPPPPASTKGVQETCMLGAIRKLRASFIT